MRGVCPLPSGASTESSPARRVALKKSHALESTAAVRTLRPPEVRLAPRSRSSSAVSTLSLATALTTAVSRLPFVASMLAPASKMS